jgi:mono/diheme cytochrome c family protein
MIPRFMRIAPALIALALASCGYQTIDEATCPPGGTKLTYEGFGRPFFLGKCNRCHSAETKDRQGAPENYVFNTRAEILEHKDRIFAESAGPNNSMPPGPDDPSIEERDKLAEWLVCGAP